MFLQFLINNLTKFITIILSYLSWQSHEKFVNFWVRLLLPIVCFAILISLVL